MLYAQRAWQALLAHHDYPRGPSASCCWIGLCFAEQQPVREGSSGQRHVGLPRATHVMARQQGGEGEASLKKVTWM